MEPTKRKRRKQIRKKKMKITINMTMKMRTKKMITMAEMKKLVINRMRYHLFLQMDSCKKANGRR